MGLHLQSAGRRWVGFLWGASCGVELYFLIRLVPSLSWWKERSSLFHSPSSCHWHREHSGALALVLGSSVGFTPWTVVEAVEKSLSFSLSWWNVKTVCWMRFLRLCGHVLVPAVNLSSQSQDQARLKLVCQVMHWRAHVLLWEKFKAGLIPVRESADRGNTTKGTDSSMITSEMSVPFAPGFSTLTCTWICEHCCSGWESQSVFSLPVKANAPTLLCATKLIMKYTKMFSVSWLHLKCQRFVFHVLA